MAISDKFSFNLGIRSKKKKDKDQDLSGFFAGKPDQTIAQRPQVHSPDYLPARHAIPAPPPPFAHGQQQAQQAPIFHPGPQVRPQVHHPHQPAPNHPQAQPWNQSPTPSQFPQPRQQVPASTPAIPQMASPADKARLERLLLLIASNERKIQQISQPPQARRHEGPVVVEVFSADSNFRLAPHTAAAFATKPAPKTPPTATISPAKPRASFLSLPTELRLRIYTHHFASLTAASLLQDRRPGARLALALTCKRVAAECLSLLHASAVYQLNPSTAPEPPKHYQLLHPTAIARTTHLSLSADSADLHAAYIPASLPAAAMERVRTASVNVHGDQRMRMMVDFDDEEGLCAEVAVELDTMARAMPKLAEVNISFDPKVLGGGLQWFDQNAEEPAWVVGLAAVARHELVEWFLNRDIGEGKEFRARWVGTEWRALDDLKYMCSCFQMQTWEDLNKMPRTVHPQFFDLGWWTKGADIPDRVLRVFVGTSVDARKYIEKKLVPAA